MLVRPTRRLSPLALSVAAVAQAAPTPPTPPTEFVVPGVRKVTVGGQYRLRYENQIDFDLAHGTQPDSNDFFTQRVRLAVGLDFSDRLAVFLQLQDVREFGEETSTLDDSADGLDFHQAWAEVKAPPLGGATRIGRQELSLGDQRLVGALDWKSQARSFDGLTQTWKSDAGTSLQLWAFQVRETTTPATVDDDRWFGGVQASGSCCPGTTGDLYAMVLHDDGLTPGASATRVTLGTRWVTGQGQPWELGLELATQTGEQAGADIPIGETHAAHAHLTHRFDAAGKPWLKAELNVASGDDPATADRERFDNLFPTAHAHWGMLDLALWENTFNPMLQFGLAPCDLADVTLAWNFFRSMEARDSFGGPNGTLVPANATDARTIGNEIDVVYTRRLELGTTAKTTLQFGYGVFLPGSAPDSIGRDTVAHFAYTQFDVRF
ncbi:MAG: alginate export family protein [Planctomycetota bacterium]